MVLLPALDEMVWAAKGEGCWWNGRRAQVSQTGHLQEACLIYTESGSFAKYGQAAERRRLIARWDRDIGALPR